MRKYFTTRIIIRAQTKIMGMDIKILWSHERKNRRLASRACANEPKPIANTNSIGMSNRYLKQFLTTRIYTNLSSINNVINICNHCLLVMMYNTISWDKCSKIYLPLLNVNYSMVFV